MGSLHESLSLNFERLLTQIYRHGHPILDSDTSTMKVQNGLFMSVLVLGIILSFIVMGMHQGYIHKKKAKSINKSD